MTEQEFHSEKSRLKKAEFLRKQIGQLEFSLRIYDDNKRLGRISVDEDLIERQTIIHLESSVPIDVHHGIAGVLRGWLSRLKAELEAL